VLLDPNMARKMGAILQQLLAKAIGLGADQLEVEYKDGAEEVFAMKSGVGLGIGSFRSSSPEAKSLRNELYALAKKRQRAKIDKHTYELRARVFDSFGEDAFRVHCDVFDNCQNGIRKSGATVTKTKPRIPEDMQRWIDARKRFHLSHVQVQMARELGMNPRKLGSLDNHKQERWKAPLPVFIEQCYLRRFGKAQPDRVISVEDRAREIAAKKAEKRERRKGAEALSAQQPDQSKRE